MIKTFFATKKTMTQAWDDQGRRLAITKLTVEPNYIVGDKIATIKTDSKRADSLASQRIVEIGYGQKKIKNMSKPLRTRLDKAGLTAGVRQIVGVRELEKDGPTLEVGQTLNIAELAIPGAGIKVQGTTKGRGFAGAIKRHGFHGGPKTHGQSDRARAVGSIGNRTTPGRVWLGKKMPGHYGVDVQTVTGIYIAHFDPTTSEIWVTGAIPGAFNSLCRITLTGKTKKNFALNKTASGIVETPVEPAPVEDAPVATPETTVETPTETPTTPETPAAAVEQTEQAEKAEKA